MDDLLMRDETLFRNPEVFEFDYLPDALLFRDPQLQSLRFNILPALRGLSPINSIIVGPPATGKTSAVKFLFRELENERSLLKAYVNCNVEHTRYLVLSRIFRELFGFSPPASGISIRQLLEKIMSHLEKEKKPLIIALDDAGVLSELDETLNSILRAREVFSGVKIGVILVFSEPEFRKLVTSRSISILQAQEISFPPYRRDEIREILQRRISLGLYPGVMSDEILERIVDETERSGDLRFGISMIKFAALHAERKARRKITEEDLSFATEQSRKEIFASILGALGEKELLVLKKLLEIEEETINSGDLYRAVNAEKKMGYTNFYEILNKLDNLRLIHMDFTGKGHRGRSRIIRLRYPRDPLRESVKMLER